MTNAHHIGTWAAFKETIWSAGSDEDREAEDAVTSGNESQGFAPETAWAGGDTEEESHSLRENGLHEA